MSNDILRELAACKASDPYRTKAWIPHMRGKWMTVNVPAELWGRIQAAARPPECVGKDPRGCWNVRCQLGGTCCRALGVTLPASPGVAPAVDGMFPGESIAEAARSWQGWCEHRSMTGLALFLGKVATLADGVTPCDAMPDKIEAPSTDASETVSAIYRALSRGNNLQAQRLAAHYLDAKHERARNAGVGEVDRG